MRRWFGATRKKRGGEKEWILARIIVALVCAFFLQCISWVRASAEDRQEQLTALMKRVEAEEAKLVELESSRKKLSEETSKKQKVIDELHKRSTNLNKQLTTSKLRAKELDTLLGTTGKRIDESQSRILKRIRSLYLTQAHRTQGSLLALRFSNDLVRDAIYTRRIHENDRKLLGELISLVRDKLNQKRELQELIAQHDQLRTQLESDGKTLSLELTSQRQLLRQLEQQKASTKQSLQQLRVEATRLESVVASFMSTTTVTPLIVEPRPTASVGPQEDTSPSERSFTGDGLRQGLLLPIKGKVVQKFGRHKVSEFADFVFSKGVEFASMPGTEVRAVEQGIAKFVGKLPGYGQVVILDHGKRDYSLYGRLGESNVRMGAVVQKAQAIGKLGELDPKGRNFYFEIRKGGSPQDPLRLFKS